MPKEAQASLGQWPACGPDDWCGEHKPVETGLTKGQRIDKALEEAGLRG